MKRLLKISFDLSLLSFIPVVSWFALSLLVDKNLLNIFTLTYPLQFIYYILKSVLSTGANISMEKDKNKNAVMSGLVLAVIISILLFGTIVINIDSYINFMNMDISTYKVFTIYAVILLGIQLIFAIVLDKLYYEEKNDLANKYSFIFNILNFLILIIASLITKNQTIIVAATLIPLSLFTLYILIKSWDRFKFDLNIKKCIQYDSLELFENITFFLIFLFGLSNVLEFGKEYALAITFVSLITDTQWDTFTSIITAAKIDISKNKFNYIESRNNAYKLMLILLLSIMLMFGILYWFYDLNIKIVLLYLLVDTLNFTIYPIYTLKACYLQLEWSALKATSNKLFSSFIRMILSLLKTPFCTSIGQITSAVYQLITVSMMFKKNYRINDTGYIVKIK